MSRVVHSTTVNSVVKGLLIGCAVLAVIGIAIGVAGFWWIRGHRDELLASGKTIQNDAMAFGKTVAEPRCVDEALARYLKDSGIVGSIRSSLWLDGCLKTSALTDGFCDGVPAMDEITRTAFWRNEQCSKRGLSGGQCTNVLAPWQNYCYSDIRSKKKPQAQ
jgi:hypothetical protein